MVAKELEPIEEGAGPVKQQAKRIFEDLQRDHAEINDFTSVDEIEDILNRCENTCLVSGQKGDNMPLKLVRFTEDCRFGSETVLPVIEDLARVWCSEVMRPMKTRRSFDEYIKERFPELAHLNRRSRHLQALVQTIRPFYMGMLKTYHSKTRGGAVQNQ